MKKFLCLLGGCALLYLGYWYLNQINPVVKTVDQPMQVAFQSAHAVFSQVKLQGWAKINEDFCSGEKLNQYEAQVERILSLRPGPTRAQTSDPQFTSLQVKGEMAEGLDTEIIFQSLNQEERKETFLIITVMDSQSPELMTLSRQKIRQAFQEFNRTPELNQLMIGFKEGKMAPNKYRQVVQNMFHAVGGRITGGVEEKNYISKTGYVANLTDTLKVGQDQVNMQVALSYNDLENRTYIYLGSPLVFTDY